MEEQEAIAQLKRGDIGGLEPLVRKYQVQAVRAAYLVTRDRALAEEIVQASFLRAYERIAQFDAGRPFGPWFLRSVTNDAVKAAARRERLTPLETDGETSLADLLADPNPGPDELAEAAEARQAIWDALGKLPPAQRAAVVSRYYLGLSEAEMALRLDCPPGTVKWRLHAARERLRRLLRPLWPGATRAERGE
ncbi:MAG TPA: RNA polymerase sigma factor [Anaerolineae bacterium]|nr:RNA polymerase sigma factor [Anaerolineae bacterium]